MPGFPKTGLWVTVSTVATLGNKRTLVVWLVSIHTYRQCGKTVVLKEEFFKVH